MLDLQVATGHITKNNGNQKPCHLNKTGVLFDKLIRSRGLPSVSVSNVRSLKPRINSYVKDLLESEISVGLISELWEKEDDRQFQDSIERIFEMKGMKYISTPRSSLQRGGGAGIVVNTKNFKFEKIDVHIPHNLEIVWGLVWPKLESEIKVIVVSSFYLPPKSRNKTKLFDHISSTVNILLSKYPKSGLIIGGDRNEFSISPLLTVAPKLKQIVTLPTRQNKILDVLITNLAHLYTVPVIHPPVAPDASSHVPSDHSVPVSFPLCDKDGQTERQSYVTKSFRPLPESGVRSFGQWIISENWQSISESASVSEQVDKFQQLFSEHVDHHFPLKEVRYSRDDLPFITCDLKKLDRKCKREYRKRKNSPKFRELKKGYNELFHETSESYFKNVVDSVRTSKPGKAYRLLRKLGARPGEDEEDATFMLPEHTELNLSPEQSADRIADHFASVSQEFDPVNISRLPSRVQRLFNLPESESELPIIEEHDVWSKICQAKVTKSVTPGDIPGKLSKEFSAELSGPLSKIFSNIVKSGEWPQQWKLETVIPIPKNSNPQSEDEIRVISLTSWYSKLFEKFVIEWLMEFIGDKIDLKQFGGKKVYLQHIT